MTRHAMLQVQWGRRAQERAVLTPGTELSVGRTERADFMVPGDEQLAGVHFTLAWDGDSCRLQQRREEATILINGETRAQATLVHGDWIRAGQTDFRLFIEGTLPVREPVERSAEQVMHTRAALDALRAASSRLYALLDSARDIRISELLQQSPSRHRSLYEGGQATALADVAPYLVELDPGGPLPAQLIDEGWGRSWGVFLITPLRFDALRRHLRRFLIVCDERGERLYFRFYDPRVLMVFLRASRAQERSDVLGEIERVICEDRTGAPLIFER